MRSAYGWSLLVAAGWYVTAAAAVAVAVTGVPVPPGQCLLCMSPGEGLLFAAVLVGLPALAPLAVVTVVVAHLLTRVVGSAVLAGSLTAAISGTAVAAIALGVGIGG